jgi:hypothetical protein
MRGTQPERRLRGQTMARAGLTVRPLFNPPHMGWQNRDKSRGSQGAKPPKGAKPPVYRPLQSRNSHQTRDLALDIPRLAERRACPAPTVGAGPTRTKVSHQGDELRADGQVSTLFLKTLSNFCVMCFPCSR